MNFKSKLGYEQIYGYRFIFKKGMCKIVWVVGGQPKYNFQTDLLAKLMF